MSWKHRGVDLGLSLLKDDGQPDQFIVEELDLDDLSLAFHEHRHVGLDIGAGNRDAESPFDSFAKEVAFELVGSFAPSTLELTPTSWVSLLMSTFLLALAHLTACRRLPPASSQREVARHFTASRLPSLNLSRPVPLYQPSWL